MTTLHVKIESDEEYRDRVYDDLKAFERGELDDDEVHQLSLPDEQALSRLFSAANIELIRAIAEYEPASMREAADCVGRDIKEVHRNLTELEKLDLVKFETNGRSKRPVVWYDEIDVQIDMPTIGSGGKTGASA